MKKKIALFLIAALLCAGLIVGCGDEKKPEVIPPDDGPTEYTVTFDTDGGTPATIAPIKVESGKTVGAAKWPDDPSKDGYIFDGWFEGATKYEYSTAITKDVTLKAKYSLRPAKYLGGFTVFGGAVSQKGWASNGVDDGEDLEFEEISSAKYIVLHTRGGSGTGWAAGFGGISVIIQSAGNSWAWGPSQTNIDAVTFARAADKDVFIVIDISKIKTYSDFISSGGGKIIIQYAVGTAHMNLTLGLQAAYLSYKALASPEDAVELDGTNTGIEGPYGFVTDKNILGLTLPETFYTVNFNTDGGAPAPASIKVGAGKPMGVQYPTWIEKDDYKFNGWFVDAKTEYTTKTPVTSDVYLIASWFLAPLPAPSLVYDSVTVLGRFSAINGPTQQGWGTEKDPNGLSGYTLTTNTWLLLETKGGNGGGWGGLDLIYQSPSNYWAQVGYKGWTPFTTKDATKTYYIAFKLNVDAKYTNLLNDGIGDQRILIQSSPWSDLGLQRAYLTDRDLSSLASKTVVGDGSKYIIVVASDIGNIFE